MCCMTNPKQFYSQSFHKKISISSLNFLFNDICEVNVVIWFAF